MVTVTRMALAVLAGLAASAAAAQDDATPSLVIYTYDAFAAEWGPGPALKAGFEARCDCTVDFVAADSSIGALRRAQLEGDDTRADIILGLDTAVSAEARATGLFAPHGLEFDGLALPVEWTDPDFVPVDYGYFAFVYNTEMVTDPPASFRELAESDLDIVIQDPRSATPGLGLVLWIKAAHGDEAVDIWDALSSNVVTVAPGWSEAYALFLDGEADMVLSYTTSPAYHLIAEDDDRFAAARFEEGHYTQIETAGILASSSEQELARDFLEWLVTPEAQAEIPETNWMYPVVDLGDALDPGFAGMIDPDPALLMDEETVGAGRSAWIEEALAQLR